MGLYSGDLPFKVYTLLLRKINWDCFKGMRESSVLIYQDEKNWVHLFRTTLSTERLMDQEMLSNALVSEKNKRKYIYWP